MRTICHEIGNFGIFPMHTTNTTKGATHSSTTTLHLLLTPVDTERGFSNMIYLYISENSVAPPGVIGEDVFIVTIADTVSLRRHPILNLKLKLMQAGVEVGLDGPGSKAK